MPSKGSRNADKGAVREELLATYFRNSGYFVVRGVPFDYGEYSVTDIDLWLYMRTSTVAREVAIVDVKNKRTPQAIERIFWTKGLQAAVGADRALVATSDSREEVQRFGRELGVVVLDGSFIRRLEGSPSSRSERQAEELFEERVKELTLGKLDGDWRGRLRSCKSKMAERLTFDSVNLWLEHAHFFAEQAQVRGVSGGLATRCMYRVLSYAAIGIDYGLKDFAFLEKPEKQAKLEEQLRYGSAGQAGVKRTIETAIALLERFGGRVNLPLDHIRSQLSRELEEIPARILAEYFARPDVGRDLFSVARELDDLSMRKEAANDDGASVALRAFMGCLLDYWGFDRATFPVPQAHNKALQATR